MPFREHPIDWRAANRYRLGRRDQVDDRLLPTLVVRILPFDRVEHRRSRSKIEWDVVPQDSPWWQRYRPTHPASLNVAVSYTRAVNFLAPAFTVGPQSAVGDNSRKVVDVGDVVNGCHLVILPFEPDGLAVGQTGVNPDRAILRPNAFFITRAPRPPALTSIPTAAKMFSGLCQQRCARGGICWQPASDQGGCGGPRPQGEHLASAEVLQAV